MKRKLLLFSLLLALMAPWAAMAQSELTIYENGSATSNYVPVYGLWADDYLKCEFVVPADELAEMNGGTISQMTFYLTTPAAAAWTGTFQVFLGEVDNATISSFYGSGIGTIVYEGQLDGTQSTMTVEFSDNYTYNGSNLLVGVYEIVSGNYKSATFAGENVTGASGSGYSGSSLDAVSFTQRDFVPKTTFIYTSGGGPVCERPETMEVTDVTSTSALLSWTGGEGTYNVEYKKASDEVWTSALTNSTLTEITLSDLAPGTNYQARVQSTCGTDPETGDAVTSGWKSVSFATMFGIPLIEPFATTTIPNGWARYSGLLSNVMSGTALTPISSYWTFGTGSNGVFDSHAYINNYSTGHYYWLVTPAVLMENNVEVSFDLALTKYSGTLQPVDPAEQADDKFVVLITTDNGTTWEILRQWDNEGSEYVYNNIACSATGEYVAIDLSNYSGQNVAIAFYAESTVAGGDNNLHIDNVSINYIPTCQKPFDPSATNITAHSAELSWTANNGETAWTVYYKKVSEQNYAEEATNSNPFTLEGLDAASTYQFYVVANCSAEDQSEPSSTFTFATECEAITTYPYTENFDSYTGVTSGSNHVLPLCWNYINETSNTSYSGYPLIYNSSTYSNSGNNHLYLYSYYSSSYTYTPLYAILPEMEGLNGKQLTLYARAYNTSSSFTVGMMTDPSDASTFVEIDTKTPSSTTTYEEFTFILGEGNYVAIKMEAANSSSTYRGVRIDDIMIDFPPTCLKPTDLAASETRATTTKLTWTPGAEGQTQWQICFGDEENLLLVDADTTYTLTNLVPDTTYTVKIRAYCDETDQSYWSNQVSFTTYPECIEPVDLTVSDITAYGATMTWYERGNSTNWVLAYKKVNDTVFTEISVRRNPTMTLSDLEVYTEYIAKVRPACDSTKWSSQVSFTTLQTCPAPTEFAVIDSTINAYGATFNWQSVYSDSWNVKYRTPDYVIGTEEHFNTNSAPQGWTRYNALLSDVLNGGSLGSTTTSGWMFTNTNVFGQYHAKVNIYGTSCKYWLVTPEMTLADGPAMSFDLALTDFNNADPIEDATAQADDKFVVLIYVNDAWTILREWNNSGSEDVYNTISTTGENVFIDLSAYQGQTVKIAFYGESTAVGGDNDMHIDNVFIGTAVAATEWTEVAADAVPFELTGLNPESYYEVVVTGNCGDEISEESASVYFTTTPSCMAPTELVVIDSTIAPHAATLSWTENGSATEWQIEFTYIADTIPVTQTIYVTENPYTMTGLLAETPYVAKVQAYCGQLDQSQWSNTVRFTTLVACPAPIELAVDEESLSTTGATLTWNGFSNSYILQMADLSAASISEEVVEAFSENFEGGSVPAGWTSEGAATWSVGTGDYTTATGAHGGTYNAKITHGTTGNVTYFVSPVIDLSAYTNAMLSCWYVNRQWVSDIDGFGVYYRLGNGEWNELFSTTAAHSSWTQLSQLALPSESNVQLGFKFTDGYGYGVGLDDILIEGNPFAYEWTTFDSEATSPYTFENLTPGTTYMVRVIGNCGEEGESVPSAAISFTTVATCVVPTDLAATDVTAHTATLVWNGENDSYVVNYRVAAGTQDWINVDFEDGLPDGWTNEGASSWSVGTGDYTAATGAHGGSYNALITHNTTGDVTYLVSPAIDLSEQSDLSLNLWYINRQWVNDIDEFGIYYRIDGGAWNEIFATTAAHSSWTELNQALPAGAYAANCQFGFKFTDRYGYGVGLDDINISIPTPAGEWMTATANENTVVLSGFVGETTYEAMVQAVCSDDDSSDWTEVVTFTTLTSCSPVEGLAVDTVGTHMAVLSWEAGDATTWQICVNGDENNLIEVTDSIYYMEGLTHNTNYTVKVRAYCGEEDGASAWRIVNVHTEIACNDPENLTVENIGTESATLMWEGTSDSYVVQYMPWEQVGNDEGSTSVMTTYTYDLSNYSGMGSIAIRHYNISDLFSLNVDDIVVTNAQDEVVFSEDFEGGISSAISIMDLDGDGYTWSMGSTSTDSQGNPTGNGNYYVTSSSYDNNVGALTPDNWLVISGVELGGQLTLVARAQDPEWTGDNFGVFVSAEDGAGEEFVEGDTQIDIWDLAPNTSYSWQVKGMCGEDESQWVASFFTTMDDYLTFVTDGDWNDANNWNPAEVPTTDKNVHIEANAIIPAGVVAEANNVTIDGGSITIKDGGQMKLNSQAEVVMEKEITGYGESNGNYYLIASPFTGRTQFGYSTWNHVDSLIYGEYDLYTFDRYYGEDEEWVNYKAHPEHIAYQSEAQGNAGLFEKEGYLYANQDSITLVFTGKINKNNDKTETKAVVYDSINRGWALVGNTYACNAYLSFANEEGDMTEANYYVMNAAGNDFELAETTDGIAPLTAAFVNFEANGTVYINSEMPEPFAGKFNRTGKFIMNLSQDGNAIDKAVVRFGKGLNLEKMSLNNDSKLYFSNNDKDYAVVYSSKTGNMPVSFKAEAAGSYTINCAADGVSFTELVLVDNVNNTKVDLLANPSYTFETEAGEFAGRFTIVYKVK